MSMALENRVIALEKAVATHAKAFEQRVEKRVDDVVTLARAEWDALLRRLQSLEDRARKKF